MKANVKVTVMVELEIDTDRPVVRVDDFVLDSVRKEIGTALNNYDLDINCLGHYIERVSATDAELVVAK
jgi:hypothetical protein